MMCTSDRFINLITNGDVVEDLVVFVISRSVKKVRCLRHGICFHRRMRIFVTNQSRKFIDCFIWDDDIDRLGPNFAVNQTVRIKGATAKLERECFHSGNVSFVLELGSNANVTLLLNEP